MSQKLENAKKLYLEGVLNGHPKEAVYKYTGARYTQHSTGVKDGQEGFIEFFNEFIERNPERDIKIIRGWEDGQYVFLHAYQSINDGQEKWVTTDFFDTDESDKIIEHWDVISEYMDFTPSGHTSIDGETKITDLNKTEENKALIRNLLSNLIAGKTFSEIESYIFADQYIQHNSNIPDGLEPVKKLVFGSNQLLSYQKIVLLVGKGNFVATLCKATWKEKPIALVDIFRIENGLVVEHWDNSEPVPTPHESVNNGKF